MHFISHPDCPELSRISLCKVMRKPAFDVRALVIFTLFTVALERIGIAQLFRYGQCFRCSIEPDHPGLPRYEIAVLHDNGLLPVRRVCSSVSKSNFPSQLSGSSSRVKCILSQVRRCATGNLHLLAEINHSYCATTSPHQNVS